MKLYICNHCKNIITYLENTGVPVTCCDEKMKEIAPNTFDGATEKHLPVYNVEGNLVKVTIGSVEHPMVSDHYIKWIIVETNLGYQIKYLQPDTKPYAEFVLSDNENVTGVYEFCNKHGVWKA